MSPRWPCRRRYHNFSEGHHHRPLTIQWIMRHYFLQGSFGVFNKCALMSLGLMIYILYIRLSAWCVSQCFYRQSLNLKREKNIFKGVILCKIDLLHLIAGASEQPLSSFLSCSHWGSFEPRMHLPHFNLFYFFSFLMFPGSRQDAVAPAVGVLLVAVVLTALVAAFVVNRRRMRKFGF